MTQTIRPVRGLEKWKLALREVAMASVAFGSLALLCTALLG